MLILAELHDFRRFQLEWGGGWVVNLTISVPASGCYFGHDLHTVHMPAWSTASGWCLMPA
jgi:hypothetical protein